MSSLFPDDGCVDIQDLYKWQDKIYDVLQEYVDNPDDYDGCVFAIYPSLEVAIEKAEDVISNPEIETFKLDSFIRKNEDGENEVDVDRIDEVSNQFMFVAR